MDDSATGATKGHDPTNYAFSGKIMLTSVLVLFIVCILIVLFHMYARYFLLRRNIPSSNHHLRRSYLSAITTMLTPRGLDSKVVKALPTFVYESKNHGSTPLECAVCLSEFEDNETGRILPKCNHLFHVECIDMWFHSHDNCPLCRAQVRLQEPKAGPVRERVEIENAVVIVVNDEAACSANDSVSGLCSKCQGHDAETGCSSSSPLPPPPPSSSSPSVLELTGVTVDTRPVQRGDSEPAGSGSDPVQSGSKQQLTSGQVLTLKRFLSI